MKVSLIFVALLAIFTVRVFIFDVYKIPSTSMSPAILPGDYVLVNKLSYGPRIINLIKLIFSREAKYIWLEGLDKIKKNDIIVFNYPQYEYLADSITFIYGTPLIKRCFGIAGDTIKIRKNHSKISNSAILYNNLFPYDTSLHWSLGNYGPLYVPRKGDTLSITPKNIQFYRDVLLYENISSSIQNASVFTNGAYSKNHTFKYNYYFMLGDNFYQSRDSRFWGFLPETHIIGKAVLVLFSLDQEAPWYKKFRGKRFLKRIV
jgi:signal peptidase I